MKKNFVVSTALFLGIAALAHAQAAPTKIAIINMQGAILSTKDGQKAQQELQTKFTPKKSELDKKQSDLAALQETLRKGSATLSDEAKAKMQNDITNGQKGLTRDGEDFDAEVQQEEQKLMGDLWQKMMDVVTKYATQNGYAMVVDVSNQQTVIWADPSTNITAEAVKLYDQAHPGTGGAAPAAAPKPAGTGLTAPRPAGQTAPPGIKPPAQTPPTPKKQ
ncbi:MAG TPA: OmpH family outer membrane protein [Bryobacteraceae bacterium]